MADIVTKNYQYDNSLPYFIGKSSATKPDSAPIGSLFLETDSHREFVMSSTNYWVLKQKFSSTNAGL